MKNVVINLALFLLCVQTFAQDDFDFNKLSLVSETEVSNNEDVKISDFYNFKKDSLLVIKIKFNEPSFVVNFNNSEDCYGFVICKPKKYRCKCFCSNYGIYQKKTIKKKISDNTLNEQCVEIRLNFNKKSVYQGLFVNGIIINPAMIVSKISIPNKNDDVLKITVYN